MRILAKEKPRTESEYTLPYVEFALAYASPVISRTGPGLVQNWLYEMEGGGQEPDEATLLLYSFRAHTGYDVPIASEQSWIK